MAGAVGIKKYWEEGRSHVHQNPSHEAYDIFVDKRWHERAAAKEPTTWLLAGAYEWSKALEGEYHRRYPKGFERK
jgi:hypothetical protein